MHNKHVIINRKLFLRLELNDMVERKNAIQEFEWRRVGGNVWYNFMVKNQMSSENVNAMNRALMSKWVCFLENLPKLDIWKKNYTKKISFIDGQSPNNLEKPEHLKILIFRKHLPKFISKTPVSYMQIKIIKKILNTKNVAVSHDLGCTKTWETTKMCDNVLAVGCKTTMG